MAVIDTQVHVYERNHPDRPWSGAGHGLAEVTGGDMIAALDHVGVDGALLVSAWGMYRYDPSYMIEVHAAQPERFAMVLPVDAHASDIEVTIEEWAGIDGAVGVRLVLLDDRIEDVDHAGLNRVATAAQACAMPLCVLSLGRLGLVGDLARRFPDCRLVVDHLGLHQTSRPPVRPEPFADLPQLLALSTFPNVAVKLTGVLTLSTHAFPFPDVWDHLARVFDSFGFDRCMWGTDWTWAVAMVSYFDAVASFTTTDRLDPVERDALMGGTAERIFGWKPEMR